MVTAAETTALPAGLARSLDALGAMAALLACADEKRLASLARPAAHGIGVILGRLKEDIALEAEALMPDRPTG
jgi:hypothetical protein